MNITRLVWNYASLDHLWRSHQVLPEEVHEIIFGVPGEDFSYTIRRDAGYYIIYGETSSGRLLKLVGEETRDGFRVFAARDMTAAEKRKFRKTK